MRHIGVDLIGQFMGFLQGSPAALRRTWFTDETHFHIHGCVTKQNIRIWSAEFPGNKTTAIIARNAIIWCAVPGIGFVGLIFPSVASDRYRDILEDDFLPFLQGMGFEFKEMFIQQDQARSHTAKARLDGVSILTIMFSLIASQHG
jgi:hypothetical protein